MSFNDEQSVMKELGISTWKDLTKKNFMSFVSMMPEMSDEVRTKIIEQLPEFTKLCSEGIEAAKKAFQSVLDKNERLTEKLIDNISVIQESIAKELNKDNLTSEDRKEIMDALLQIAKIYNEMDDRNKKFFDTVFGKLLAGIGVALGAAILFVGGKLLIDD